MTGPGEDERVKRRGKGDWETYLLGGVMSLLLPVGLVNGGGNGQEARVVVLSPAVCQKLTLAPELPPKALTRALGTLIFTAVFI